MQLEEIRALVKDELAATDELIINSLSSDINLAKEIGNHIVASGGKRIRPLVVLLSAQALNYQGDKNVTAAAIIELLHTATLLHDDVIDNSEMRRGKLTANSKWGNRASVLVGDLLYARAFELIASLEAPRVTNILADATSMIVEGEVLQLTHCHDPTTTEATYIEIIKRKTGQLFRAAAVAVAYYMNAPEPICQALNNYGENLGIAFQMLDDALDYDANPEETGKNLGDDLAEGKPTLPLIYILNHGTTEQASLVRQAINQDHQNIDEVQAIIKTTGAIEYTKQLASRYVQRSIADLSALPASPARDALAALAKLAGNRAS